MEQQQQPSAAWTLRSELRLACFSLVLGSILMAGKFAAYYLTGSAAIFSDAMESIVNVLAAGFALYAVLLAHQPADAEHPYGHGKIEFLSAAFEGGMILLATIAIVARAVQSLVEHESPSRIGVGVIITAISAVLCAAAGLLLWQRGRSAGSMTLEADGVHLLSDAGMGTAVVAALAAFHFTHWAALDPLAALGVSAWIAWQAVNLMRRAAAGLMDEQDSADAVLLAGILDGHVGPNAREPRICGYHKIRHRHSGRQHWVDLHIQVPASWAVEQGHRVATAIELEIQRALAHSRATTHVEPCTNAACPFCQASELSV